MDTTATRKTKVVSHTTALLNEAESLITSGTQASLDKATHEEWGASKWDELGSSHGAGAPDTPTKRKRKANKKKKSRVTPVATVTPHHHPDLRRKSTGTKLMGEVIAAKRLQKLMRGFVVRKWMGRIYKFSHQMSPGWFAVMLTYLLTMKVVVFVTFALATADTFMSGEYILSQDILNSNSCALDLGPSGDASPLLSASGRRVYATYFHGYKQSFGLLYDAVLRCHLVTAILLIWVLPVALVTKKGSYRHIYAGRAFLSFWVLHFANGMANASQRVIASGWHEANYPTVPGTGFSMWLYIQFSFIATVMADFLIHGIATVQYKLGCPLLLRLVFIIAPLTTITLGAALFLFGIYAVAAPASDAMLQYGVVFLVQTPAYTYLLVKNIAHWGDYDLGRALHTWIVEHQRNMLFAANLTALVAIANLAERYCVQATGAVWALTDISVFLWIGVKNRKFKEAVANSTVTLRRRHGQKAKQKQQQQQQQRVTGLAARYKDGVYHHSPATTATSGAANAAAAAVAVATSASQDGRGGGEGKEEYTQFPRVLPVAVGQCHGQQGGGDGSGSGGSGGGGGGNPYSNAPSESVGEGGSGGDGGGRSGTDALRVNPVTHAVGGTLFPPTPPGVHTPTSC